MFKSILCSSEGFEIPVIDEEIIYELVGRKSAFKYCREAILQLFFSHSIQIYLRMPSSGTLCAT